MKSINIFVLATIGLLSLFLNGCTSMKEVLASQMEVPTLEKQVNRVAIGMTIVRENNIMAFKMPISSDAKWPELISRDLNDTQKQEITQLIKEDPYYATVHYTEHIQRDMLGSGATLNQLGGYGNLIGAIFNQTISPITYRAIYKIEILFGKDPKNWPNIFEFEGSMDNFMEFSNGNLQPIEALNGDVYEQLGEAVISLMPVNLQKDLKNAREEMLESFLKVGELKKEKGDLETKLKRDEVLKNKSKQDNTPYIPLNETEKDSINEQIDVLEQQIKEEESIAKEKEEIYLELLNSSKTALESEINLDDKDYVDLAINVNRVAKEIDSGATEAYTTFGTASTMIIANNIIQNFSKELKSLAIAKMYVPSHLQSKYNQRLKRLVKNAVFLLPNIFVGTYYAHKQAKLAQKYKELTDIIVEAYVTKQEQEKIEQENPKGSNKDGDI